MCVTKTKTNPKLPTSVAQCTQRAQSGNWLLALKRWTDNTNTKQLLFEWIGLAFQTHNCPKVLHSVVNTAKQQSGNSLHSNDESITFTLCAPSNSCCTSESALLFKNGLFGLLAYCYLLCTERLFADYFIPRRAYLTPGKQLLQL